MLGSGLPPPPAPQQATRITRPKRTGSTVTVACKLPGGLILRCFAWEEYDEPLRDGGYKRVRVARPNPAMTFTVRGTWAASAGQAFNKRNPAVAELLPGEYALTHGVPADLWDLWYEQNRNSQYVRKKLIFAHENHNTVVEEAKRYRDTKTGVEPLDAEKPGERMPGGVDRRLRIGILEQDAGTSSR